MTDEPNPIRHPIVKSLTVSAIQQHLLVAFTLCVATALVFFSSISLRGAGETSSLTVRTNYYAITGTTFWELRDSMRQARPMKDSSEGDAQTDWHIQWTFTTESTGNGCRLRSFTTQTTITITMPSWSPPADVSSELVKRWTNYFVALQKHEDGHRQLAQSATAEVTRRTRGMRGPCETLKESISNVAKQVVAEYRQKEREYDEKTEHGIKTGAKFP